MARSVKVLFMVLSILLIPGLQLMPQSVAGADYGSISGVVKSDDGASIAGARVNVWCDTTAFGTRVYTAADGSYIVTGLPSGSYLVYAMALGYVTEYYDNQYQYNGPVTLISVTPPNNAGNINFTLGPSGSVSGVVTNEAGTPIGGAMVYAQGNGTFYTDFTSTLSDGSYALSNLLPDAYLVYAQASGYVMEYYDNAYAKESANLVAVAARSNNAAIGFSLSTGGSISGVVYNDSGSPISDALVQAAVWGGSAAGYDYTSSDGSYIINGLASGDYLVYAQATGYVREYYDNSRYKASASPVAVTAPSCTSSISFSLPSTAVSDTTPPSAPVVADDGVSTTSTTQLHANWTASDAESGIAEYQYAIGTTVGGTNVVAWTSTGTTTQVTKTGLSLSVGTTYYFSVKAKNGAGLWSSVGPSDGIAVVAPADTTPPATPVVTDDGVSTTSTSQLHASWTASDAESGIAEYQYAIGTTSGGTNIVTWTSVGTSTQVTKTGLSLTVGSTYYFSVKAKNGAGLWSGLGSSNGIAVVDPPDTTAPTTPVVTDDGASITTTTQLHASWTSADAESGIAEYQYAIGATSGGTNIVTWTSVGTSTQVTKTGLSLAVGTTYYFSVKAKNGAALWSSVGVSDGIAVVAPPDTTPPTTPVVTDDGPSTTSRIQLHASWTSSDAESGIVEYQYAIGTTAGGTNVVAWTLTGISAQVTETGLSLSVGSTYYFSVKAKNGAGLWSTVGVSDGIAAVEPPDTTAPTTPVVTDDGASTTSTTQLHASWTSADAESGIAEYQYAIGTTSGGTNIVTWTSVGTSTQVTKTGLSLAVGTIYYFSVKAKNGAGLWSGVGTSDGIGVVAPPDTTPPTTPVVTDDGAATTSTSQLHASWTSSDAESGIAEYQYAVGTTAGGTNVVAWTSTGTSTQVTKTGLSLSVGTTYYFSVKAKNGAALWSSVGVSDGIAVVAPPDTTPPTTPVVTDDGTTTTSTKKLHASWTSSDTESGVVEYQYAIGTSAGASDVVAWTSAGTSTAITRTGLRLEVGTTYYFSVKARNGACLWSEAGSSDGISVTKSARKSPSLALYPAIFGVAGIGGLYGVIRVRKARASAR